jgi:hypothetical protein
VLGLKGLPPDKRRKFITLYIIVTLGALVVLVFFIMLLVMLLWMERLAPLPPPQHALHPEATAYWVYGLPASPDFPRDSPRRLPRALARGLPGPMANLITKGAADHECAFQLTASLVSGSDAPRLVLATSLGRYPGLFHVIRRDLQRRARKGSLNATVEEHRDNSIFIMNGPRPLPAAGIVDCTIVRAADAELVRPVIDGIALEEAPPDIPRPARLRETAPKAVDHYGWSKAWPAVPLESLLTGEALAGAQAFRTALLEAFPHLEDATDFRFHGTAFREGFRVRITFKPAETVDPAAFAAALDGWLHAHGPEVHITSKGTAASVEETRVTVEVRVELPDRREKDADVSPDGGD